MPSSSQTRSQEQGASTQVPGDSAPSRRPASPQNAAPSLSLPKGGGAVRGIGEKFAANPVTGTGSLDVPIYTSPGRSGFGPTLSLSYDSGSGNGPFGFGWSLALPSISRKTDKGLPQYRDAKESDIFLLSGAEDLVPALEWNGTAWIRDTTSARPLYGQRYDIHRYRPRVEGLYAVIERWINVADPRDSFWRSISRDNTTTWYGKTSASRIADPADPARIFKWLISESYDDRGNVMAFQYKPEDSVAIDLSQVNERNRTALSRSANRYLKRVLYGNPQPYLPDLTSATELPLPSAWCFELVMDYGEHDLANPVPQEQGLPWLCRIDPFSTFRPAFEVRTYRLCRRALMFHHFPNESGVGLNCLVRSTDLTHSGPPPDPTQPPYSCLVAVAQLGYSRAGTGYLATSMPLLEFAYSAATVDETVREIDPESLRNVPSGIDNPGYRWVDLDGEGSSGILSEQGGAWFYKSNLSPAKDVPSFAPLQLVSQQPAMTELNRGHQQLLDVSGDGQLALVDFEGPAPGFYERTPDAGWKPFVSFQSLPVLDWKSPELKFIDLTGDGFADILISEGDAFRWHASLATAGFAAGHWLPQVHDEEQGPKLIFSDGTESVFLADMSGDGLTDLVRIRNGEVCYWPNLGYGSFGRKVEMDNAPLFDHASLFDGRRIRLADIDGSGTIDILYFAGDSVQLYFNRSGNAWGAARVLDHFPSVDALSSAAVLDLLGNGTACLVWSSPLPAANSRPMLYIDLMGGQKPHLLVRATNNLGAETVIDYAPSTKFYVADKLAGTPWVTRLPFPVHVVERVRHYDYIGRNLLTTRYAYHHGYFDGVEREFRGFGRVDQWDTDEFGVLNNATAFPEPLNLDAAFNVPPAFTKTWFHTGAYFQSGDIARRYEQEYFSEAAWTEGLPAPAAMLLDDTVLPAAILLPDGTYVGYDLSPEELREACRSLRGSILRQETYALDNASASGRPYSVSERNYTIAVLQPQGPNNFGVFVTHAREAIECHYERTLYSIADGGFATAAATAAAPATAADPRVTHAFTLAIDYFGNVLQAAAVAYGRRYLDPSLTPGDQAKQKNLAITFTESSYTNAILSPDSYRTPLAAQSSQYELIQAAPLANQPGSTNLFTFAEIETILAQAGDGAHDLPYEDANPVGLNPGQPYRRLLGQTRTLYRPDDLGASAGNSYALLPLGALQTLALVGCSYQLALTASLVSQVYQRGGTPLLPAPAEVLSSSAADGGGYVDLDGAGTHWWAPSGRVFYSVSPAIPDERNEALASGFLPRRFEDPFANASTVTYDAYGLLPVATADAVGNTASAANDYRVLAPTLVTDANGNRAAASFDVLGMVSGTAIMGKVTETLGDSLTGFTPDLSEAQIDGFYAAADPHSLAATLLGSATTRILYDLNRFQNSQQAYPSDPTQWQPVYAATLARETHQSDLTNGEQSKIQIAFSYSDGFGREIQKKVAAEPGPIVDQGPIVSPRWIGSGWSIFNNKGKPVRQYEPFYSRLAAGHQFEFGVAFGISSTLFYDPLGRTVATLHPNQTYEKIIFSPWSSQSWDVNDTVLQNDPSTDPDVGGLFHGLPPSDYLPTWYALRTDPAFASQAAQLWPDPVILAKQREAATKAAAHAGTPATAYFDPLGRPFLTVADNGVSGKYSSRVELDIQGLQHSVTDALGRKVVVYDYDILGARIQQSSMEAGERWTLNDVAGKPIGAWDTRGHNFTSAYDALRRLVSLSVLGTDAVNSDPRTLPIGGSPAAPGLLLQKTVYGEGQPPALNLNTRIFQVYDTAGVVTSTAVNPGTGLAEGYDFKGNLLRSTRQFVDDYKALPDWSAVAAPVLASEVFSSSTIYDALNRPYRGTSPDGSIVNASYDQGALLQTVSVNLQGAASATEFVANIAYDAKGQRSSIDYGNNASTAYSYDLDTFRLTRLTTTRATFPANQQTVQDLQYVYDPAGNITHIQDDADIQNAVFFRNQRVEPSNDYTYDAIYRLIQASGREQLGLDSTGRQLSASPGSYNDVPRAGLLSPGDGNAMGVYSEQYTYDEVGNFLQFLHQVRGTNSSTWTRFYNYNEPSLLEAGKFSNRLSSTGFTSGTPSELYTYDLHGNMLQMAQLHLPMRWDYKDQLEMTQRQAVSTTDADGVAHQGERTYYVYDSGGERVRKVTESAVQIKKSERFYLGGFEVYREYAGATLTLERETLHVTDDKRRIALVETRTQGTDGAAAQLVRYQFNNHLGSASLELDDAASVITYEEYCPYGNTSYQAGRSLAEVSSRRYRYTGMERDEETGLSYHGARYYASWLGRWTSTDPGRLVDGTCLYRYCSDNPIVLSDTNGHSPLPGNLGDYPEISQLWKQAVVDTVGKRLGTTTFEGTVKAFQAEVAGRIAAHGGWLGSNTKVGTAINYARTSYSGARSAFGKLAADDGISFTGTQLHHSPHLADNPSEALNPTSLHAVSGHSSTPGSGHNFADLADKARDAGSPNPGRTALEQTRARGVEPDVPELGPEFRLPSGLKYVIPLTVAAGVALFQSRNAKEFAANTAFNFATNAVPELSALTAKDEGHAVSSIFIARFVAPPLIKHVALPLATNPFTWVAGGTAAAAYLIFMKKRGFAVDQEHAVQSIGEYRAGRNIDAFCAQCHGKGGALDPDNKWNLGARYRNLELLTPVQ